MTWQTFTGGVFFICFLAGISTSGQAIDTGSGYVPAGILLAMTALFYRESRKKEKVGLYLVDRYWTIRMEIAWRRCRGRKVKIKKYAKH